MTKMIGRQVSIGIGKESSRGTAVGPDYWIPWMEATVEDRIERINNESSLGRLEDSDDSAVASSWGEGTIKGKMTDTSFPLLLLSLFGSVNTTTPESGVYDHAFSVSQSNQHQSLTVAVKDSNIDEAYPNCVIDSIQLDGELNNYVMFEAGFMGKPAESAGNTVSNITQYDFVPKMITFKHAAAQSGLDTANAVSIRNFSIEMRQNVMREQVLGSEDPNDILSQAFVVEGSVTLIHDGQTFENLQNNDTAQAMRFDITHTATIGATSNPRLRIDLYKAKIFDYERNLTQNELIEETFSFKGHYSIGDSKMLDVTFRNDTASY